MGIVQNMNTNPKLIRLWIILGYGYGKATVRSSDYDEMLVNNLTSYFRELTSFTPIIEAFKKSGQRGTKIEVTVAYNTQDPSTIAVKMPLMFARFRFEYVENVQFFGDNKIVRFDYPLSYVPNIHELEAKYALELKDLNLIIRLEFDRSISKDEFLNLFSTGGFPKTTFHP